MYKYIIVKDENGYDKEAISMYDSRQGYCSIPEVDEVLEILNNMQDPVKIRYTEIKLKDMAHVITDRKKINDSIRWQLGKGRK